MCLICRCSIFGPRLCDIYINAVSYTNSIDNQFDNHFRFLSNLYKFNFQVYEIINYDDTLKETLSCYLGLSLLKKVSTVLVIVWAQLSSTTKVE